MRTTELSHFAFALFAFSTASAVATAQTVSTAAARIGITPESMACAGLDAAQATILLNRIEACAPQRQAIEEQCLLMQQLGLQASALGDSILNDGDTDSITQYEVLRAELDVASATQEALCVELLEYVVQDLPSTTLQRLAAWRCAAVHVVPAEFKIQTRTEQEWKVIKRALRAELRASQNNQPLDPSYAELLAAVRSDPQVAEAAAGLAANLAAITAVFQQFDE